MEANPSENFILTEIERLEKCLQVRADKYIPLSKDASLSDIRKHKKEYDEKMEVTKFKKQKETLEFILNKQE